MFYFSDTMFHFWVQTSKGEMPMDMRSWDLEWFISARAGSCKPKVLTGKQANGYDLAFGRSFKIQMAHENTCQHSLLLACEIEKKIQ